MPPKNNNIKQEVKVLTRAEKKALEEQRLVALAAQEAAVQEEEDFDFQNKTVGEWMEDQGYTKAIGTRILLSKDNGYPFITFLHETELYNGKPAGTTLFFSVSASEVAMETYEVQEADPDKTAVYVTPEFMAQFQVCYVTCESAAEGFAWKLCNAGSGGKYQSTAAFL